MTIARRAGAEILKRRALFSELHPAKPGATRLIAGLFRNMGRGLSSGAASAQRRQAIGRPDFENTNFGDPEKRREFEDLLQKQIDMRDYLYKNFW